ncbi:fasciclin-3 [Asbolus verrucosus]|uniref:Fasciclin-3 n=1 Tax=Asbolus verrucosus TaxID=1661398 RepID=A0A482VBS3_ASBVE|nr:fasciclin-3 [Asbolus verrucosus]
MIVNFETYPDRVSVAGAHVEVEPGEVLVLPGQNVTVMCRLAVPLQYCRVEIPGMKALNLNAKLSHPEVSFYGPGLPAGQCGFTINRVTDKNNGVVRCMLGVETESTESVGQVHLIVARAPKVPEMDLSRSTDAVTVYKVNDVLEASCIVKDGRPVANISWFLDDEPLYRDGLSMPTVIDLAKENLQSKLQNLTRTLQASDNAKHLRCVAYHPAYQDGRAETMRQLDVKCKTVPDFPIGKSSSLLTFPVAPLPQGELDKFGYTIGQPGLISVVMQANPRPFIEWDIGGERLKENANDQTGRIEAEPITELVSSSWGECTSVSWEFQGRGQYQANLRIAAINKHDTEKIYVLNAYNDMGSQSYNIKISTSPEPEGLEIGIGGIIGITVAILVLLLIVFVVLFAKVTGRWCFSDGATVIDYTTGDSSHHAAVDGVGGDGVDNPHHQVSQEYINGNDLPVKKDEKKVDTAV